MSTLCTKNILLRYKVINPLLLFILKPLGQQSLAFYRRYSQLKNNKRMVADRIGNRILGILTFGKIM